VSEHESTAVIQRAQLQKMLDASAPPAVSAHAVPRSRLARSSESYVEPDEGTVSPLAVLAVIALLIALFVMIVQTN
jgi:hypothetical protein